MLPAPRLATYEDLLALPEDVRADPAERLLEAFRYHDGMWMRLGSYDETAVERSAPFEALELEVGLLFPPRPAAPAR